MIHKTFLMCHKSPAFDESLQKLDEKSFFSTVKNSIKFLLCEKKHIASHKFFLAWKISNLLLKKLNFS